MRIKQTHKNPPDKQPLSGDSLRGQFHLLSTGCYPRQQNTADTTSPIAANHTQQTNSVEKNKTGLLIRLTLCSALFCLHIQLGISQAGTENAAQFVFFVFPKLGLYAPIKAQIPLIPIACWFGLSAVWVFPGQKDREREMEKKIRPDITVMCHIILQGTGCFSRFLFSTFNALLVTAVQWAALWLQHTKPSHSRKCSVTELACFSTGNYSENLKSNLLCPKSQLLVYKNIYFLTGSVLHLHEIMAESNNYILFS